MQTEKKPDKEVLDWRHLQ